MDNQWKYAGIAGASILLTMAATGVARAATDRGQGPLAYVDTDGDGLITRSEWLTVAAKRFASLDANGDGKLVVGEIPPPPAPHRHGPGHRDPLPDEDGDGPDAPAR